MMVLTLILKGILKVYFRLDISSLIMMRSLEKFWKACNKIKIRIETLFVLYIQDTIFGALPILLSVYWAIPEKIQTGVEDTFF